jgi:hypothetical protein
MEGVSKIKAFFSNTYTSISIMLVVFGGLNQFQLTKVANEIKTDNQAMHLSNILETTKQRLVDRYRDSIYTVDLVNNIAIQNGSLVDYGLIDNNIKSAVKKGTRSVIAHNKMMMQAEHDKFELFALERANGVISIMKATLRKDTIPLIEEIKIGN